MALTKITTGTIADDSIQSLKNRNIIINGAMNVAQRGTSSTSNGYQTVDRFYIASGTVGLTQSQETLSSGDPYDLGFRKFHRLTNTSASSSTAAYSSIVYRNEGLNINASAWNFKSSSSYITLSFWVRSSLAGTYQAYARSIDGTNKMNSFEFTLSANTWTKVTKTFSGDSSIQIDNDNGQAFTLVWIPDYGTDYTTSGHTHDVWQTYDSLDQAKDFAQSWNNTAGATFDLTGIQLEAGSVATPFEHESYAETLQKCLRYYYRLNANGNYSRWADGCWDNVNQASVICPISVPMRSSPSVDSTGSLGDYALVNAGSVYTCTSLPSFSKGTITSDGSCAVVTLVAYSTGNGTGGNAAQLMSVGGGAWTGDFLGLDAEL